VTYDSDFHGLLAQSGAGAPSVIRLRDDRLRYDLTANLIATAIERFGPQLTAGAAVTVRRGLYRLRMLPLRAART
jgi:hypothetical protein